MSWTPRKLSLAICVPLAAIGGIVAAVAATGGDEEAGVPPSTVDAVTAPRPLATSTTEAPASPAVTTTVPVTSSTVTTTVPAPAPAPEPSAAAVPPAPVAAPSVSVWPDNVDADPEGAVQPDESAAPPPPGDPAAAATNRSDGDGDVAPPDAALPVYDSTYGPDTVEPDLTLQDQWRAEEEAAEEAASRG